MTDDSNISKIIKLELETDCSQEYRLAKLIITTIKNPFKS